MRMLKPGALWVPVLTGELVITGAQYFSGTNRRFAIEAMSS